MTARSEPTSMLRAGIVGCGQVAGYHAQYIQAQAHATLVAIADVDQSRAREFAARHGVGSTFGSLEQMLEEADLDVLHVVTPPHLHVAQGLAAVDRGVHVLVEKPIALQAVDAERLFARAAQRQVLVCPDFIHLFHPRFQQAREMIASGRLGRVVHCECFIGLDLAVEFAELQEGLKPHWSFDLPGGVLHNYITHALYLALCWSGEIRDVRATPKVFGTQPQGLTDHLDIVITGEGPSVHVTLSLVARPCPYVVKIYCERGSVQVDIDRLTLVVDNVSTLPRIVSRLWGSVSQGQQLAAGVVGNVVDRLRGRLIPYQGLRTLIGLFYESIRQGGPAPVPATLALAVSRSEEVVLAQAGKVHVDLTPRPCRQSNVRRAESVLVTGASGYLGREVVRQLVGAGYAVRCLVRPHSHIAELEALGVGVCFGDLRSREAVLAAAAGASSIVHIGAALRGSAAFMDDTAVSGTANVAEVAQAAGVGHVVYLSSLTVYDFLSLRNGDVIGPGSPLEPVPQERGGYTVAKRQAEDIALEHLRRGQPAWTILRPSVFFGNGHDPKTLVGFGLGRWLVCPGRPRRPLLLVHVKDVASAILLAIESPQARGKIYTLSHPDTVRLGDYLRTSVQRDGHRWRVVYVPYTVAYGAMLAAKAMGRLLGRRLNISPRRLASLYREVLVDASGIQEDLGWVPANGLVAELEAEATTRVALKPVVA